MSDLCLTSVCRVHRA